MINVYFLSELSYEKQYKHYKVNLYNKQNLLENHWILMLVCYITYETGFNYSA